MTMKKIISYLQFLDFLTTNIRHKDFCPYVHSSSVTLVLAPLKSETGWTGEL